MHCVNSANMLSGLNIVMWYRRAYSKVLHSRAQTHFITRFEIDRNSKLINEFRLCRRSGALANYLLLERADWKM